MNFKLLKDHDHYMLINSLTRELFATTDKTIAEVSNKYMLDKTNCMEIFGHTNIEKLACEVVGIDIDTYKHIDKKCEESTSPCAASKEGGCVGSSLYFQVKGFIKAMELNTEIEVTFEIDGDAPCSHCGEEENIHTNYDWSKENRPIDEFLCNECGKYFITPKITDEGYIILNKLK